MRMTSYVGTKSYMAPEVVRLSYGLLVEQYTDKADMWSLGKAAEPQLNSRFYWFTKVKYSPLPHGQVWEK